MNERTPPERLSLTRAQLEHIYDALILSACIAGDLGYLLEQHGTGETPPEALADMQALLPVWDRGIDRALNAIKEAS